MMRLCHELPPDIDRQVDGLLKKIDGFTDRDFKFKLGSILDADFREYYAVNRFSFFKEKLKYFGSDLGNKLKFI
jgi:hypothetical protein